MKRPSFQFYTGDWRKNAKLRRCTPAARGVWIDVLCLFHDSEDEYGILRWPLKDIANAAGAAMVLVRELVDKGVLKGADRDAPAYVYRPKHAGKVGDPVILVIADGGPVWYSSRMVRDEWVRQKRGGSTRFDTDHQPENRSPKGGSGEPVGDGPSSSSSSSENTVPNGTDGGEPPAPKKAKTKSPGDIAKAALWRAAIDVLAAGGCTSEDVARSFMGKLVKDYGLEAVRDAVAAAATEQPADARQYLKATCMHTSGERTRPVTVAENPQVQATAAAHAAEAARVGSAAPEHLSAARAVAQAARERRLGAAKAVVDAIAGGGDAAA